MVEFGHAAARRLIEGRLWVLSREAAVAILAANSEN
jgi:hypothetical protein